jgi:hypothetical protein
MAGNGAFMPKECIDTAEQKLEVHRGLRGRSRSSKLKVQSRKLQTNYKVQQGTITIGIRRNREPLAPTWKNVENLVKFRSFRSFRSFGAITRAAAWH